MDTASPFISPAELAPLLGRPDARLPPAAGLLAMSLGLSRPPADDDAAMLAAALPLYDALYAWCRQGQGETHRWTAHDFQKAAA